MNPRSVPFELGEAPVNVVSVPVGTGPMASSMAVAPPSSIRASCRVSGVLFLMAVKVKFIQNHVVVAIVTSPIIASWWTWTSCHDLLDSINPASKSYTASSSFLPSVDTCLHGNLNIDCHPGMWKWFRKVIGVHRKLWAMNLEPSKPNRRVDWVDDPTHPKLRRLREENAAATFERRAHASQRNLRQLHSCASYGSHGIRCLVVTMLKSFR